jgi:hypothetical protein
VPDRSPPPARNERTAIDPERREELRRAIWEAIAHAPPPEAAPSKRGAPYVLPDRPPWDVPAPRANDAAPGIPGIDPKYIQQRVRDDFFPLASGCYDDALTRAPGLHGKVVFAFNIVGDARTGGIVEAVDVLSESTLRDPEVIDCMRQSFLSVVFPPPASGGEVTVVYPIEFAPDD